MELKDFGLTPNYNYNGTYLVKRNDETDHYYSISRTTNKVIFYWDDSGKERRMFLKKVENVKAAPTGEKAEEPEEPEEPEDDGPGGEFDEESLREGADKETSLFSHEDNPFFDNDFSWGSTPDFAVDNDLMYT